MFLKFSIFRFFVSFIQLTDKHQKFLVRWLKKFLFFTLAIIGILFCFAYVDLVLNLPSNPNDVESFWVSMPEWKLFFLKWSPVTMIIIFLGIFSDLIRRILG